MTTALPPSTENEAVPQGFFDLAHDAHGVWHLRLADGTTHAGVVPVRAFPLSDPQGPVSLVGGDGREILWIDRLQALPEPLRQALSTELAQREFMPTIQSIDAVSTFSTPSTWSVSTDRGATQLVLKAEEDIRRLPGNDLLITDAQGMSYRIGDAKALDRRSRRLLERFL